MLFALPVMPSKNFDIYNFVNTPFGEYEVRGVYFTFTYWMVAAIVLMIFLLIFTIARMRYLYVHWSMGRQSIAFIFWGFFLAIIVEGLLLVGGRTLFTEILGWKTAPKPISTALDMGRTKLINVLGVQQEVPSAAASTRKNAKDIISEYRILTPKEAQQVKSAVCSP